MMDRWSLPKELEIGGRSYPIRYQFSAVLDILAAHADPELDADEKAEIMLTILFPDLQEMPAEFYSDALRSACEFIDCGQKGDGKPKPRLMDWHDDVGLIIPAINKAAGKEVRADPDLHWWTFMAYYMSIGESLFSTVLRIRQKRATGKKLDKPEEEFYRENKAIVDLKRHETAEEREEREKLLKMLG